MSSNALQSKIDNCYALADNGYVVVANALLPPLVDEFIKSGASDGSVLRSIERACHRMGVENAFKYAEFFYQKGDNKTAREWLRYAKDHAKGIGLNIGKQISGMKREYKDRMPLLF